MRNAFRPTVTVDEGLHEQLEQAQEDQWAVVVKPPEEAPKDPRKIAESIYRALHCDVSSVSVEMHKTSKGRIEFHTITQSFDNAELVKNRIRAEVKGEVEIVEGASLPLSPGESVAGARIEYAYDQILPLRTLKSPDAGDDLYAHVLETLAEEPERAVIQFVMKPVDYPRRYKWLYRIFQLWDERAEATWTTRWSRWDVPVLKSERRPRQRSLEIASMVSLILFALWVVVGQNPMSALLSIHLLDAIIPAMTLGPVPGFGPVHVPADLSTFVFGPSPPLALISKVTYGLMLVVVGTLYFAALFGQGLEPAERKDAEKHAELARTKGEKDDKRASRAEKKAAEAIQAQGRDIAYRVNARVVTIAEDGASASKYRNRLLKQFENSWRDTATKQHLTGTTMGRFGHLHHRLPRFLKQVARRKSTRTRWFWIQKLLLQSPRRKPMYCAPFEVATLYYWLEKSAGGEAAIEYAPEQSDPLPAGEEGYQDPVVEGVEPPEELPDPEPNGAPVEDGSSPDGAEATDPSSEESAVDSSSEDGVSASEDRSASANGSPDSESEASS